MILQVFGAGGDNYLVAGLKRRHQVGKGLAGAGAGLADQRFSVVYRLPDGLGHFDLLRPDSVIGYQTRKGAVLVEDVCRGLHLISIKSFSEVRVITNGLFLHH